jgi:putative oxidoreductase
MIKVKELFLKTIEPVTIDGFYANLRFAIPRIVCGFLLTRNFGGSKFRLPWSPVGSD